MIGYARHWSWAEGLLHSDKTLTTSGFIVAVVLMAVFVAINFLGVRVLAHTNSVTTWWKIAVPLATIFIMALTHFHGGNFTSGSFAPFGAKGVLSAISTSGIMFALLGFEQAIQLAGESRNPKRDLPRATLGSVLIGAVIYVALQIVFIAALPSSTFAKGWDHLNYVGISGPWAGLATVVGLGWLAVVLYIDAVVSPAGTGLIYATATSRISYGLSKNGYAPKGLEKTDKNGVPWIGLLVSFVTGVVCFLPFPSWQQLVGFITSASVLMYAGAPLAYGVFAKRLPHVERPYRLPAGKVIAPVSFVVANLIIYWAGWDTLWRLGVAIVLGYLLLGAYAWYAVQKGLPDAPRLDWKAAQWLPVYLIGIGVVSSQGTFGGQGHIGLWWDMLIIAVFSLGIYYWALATAADTAEIERNIGAVEVVEVAAH
jgi:amino acid transporter